MAGARRASICRIVPPIHWAMSRCPSVTAKNVLSNIRHTAVNSSTHLWPRLLMAAPTQYALPVWCVRRTASGALDPPSPVALIVPADRLSLLRTQAALPPDPRSRPDRADPSVVPSLFLPVQDVSASKQQACSWRSRGIQPFHCSARHDPEGEERGAHDAACAWSSPVVALC